MSLIVIPSKEQTKEDAKSFPLVFLWLLCNILSTCQFFDWKERRRNLCQNFKALHRHKNTILSRSLSVCCSIRIIARLLSSSAAAAGSSAPDKHLQSHRNQLHPKLLSVDGAFLNARLLNGYSFELAQQKILLPLGLRHKNSSGWSVCCTNWNKKREKAEISSRH